MCQPLFPPAFLQHCLLPSLSNGTAQENVSSTSTEWLKVKRLRTYFPGRNQVNVYHTRLVNRCIEGDNLQARMSKGLEAAVTIYSAFLYAIIQTNISLITKNTDRTASNHFHLQLYIFLMKINAYNLNFHSCI